MKQLNKNLLKNLEKLLFFLSFLLLPTQLGKHFWPESSFVYSLRIDYLSPTLYLWDLLILFLVAVVGVSAFLRVRPITLNIKFLSILLFFLICQMISLFKSANILASLVVVKEYIFVGIFGLYLSSIKFNEVKNIFFLALLISVIYSCALAVAQFLLGHSLGLWILGERSFSITTPLIAKFNFYEKVFLRPYATFPHPNLLGGFLVLSLPLLLQGLSKRLEKLKLMLSLLVFGTVFVTFSRPGLLIIASQMVLKFKKYWKLILIFSLIMTPLVFVRLSSIFTFDTLAVLRRQELSEYAIKLFLNNPLLGIGVNNFINSLASDEVLVGTNRFLQPVHNVFLLILSESGLIGLLGWLVLICSAFISNLKSKDGLSKVLLGNLLTIVFLGLFDHYFLTLAQGQRLLFMIVGISLNKNKT